jgi:mannose/fructose/N-acetylgalactosamine-specific phosphotransferase system component IIC
MIELGLSSIWTGVFDAGTLLPLILVGALLGLDTVSFPQAMIARPLVAATAGGAVLGEPANGLLVGAALELIALETLPVGASRYPEWGSASVIGGALFAYFDAVGPGALAMAVLAALATAWIGGWTMVSLRRVNGIVARRARPALERGSRGALTAVQFTGLGLDFLRGAALTSVALIVLGPVVRASVMTWGADVRISRAVVVALAAGVAGAAVWKLFHATPYARLLFLGGLAGGLALLALR